MLKLRLDAQGAIKGLQAIGGRLVGRMQNLTPVNRDMGERMEFSIEETFRQQGRPTKWKDLAPATKRARERKGTWPGKILIITAILKNSINYRADRKGLTVGTADIRARILFLGGKAGRGRKVTIPARNALVAQESDLAYYRRRILEHVQGGA
jgi:phage virion morphogenesis protein